MTRKIILGCAAALALVGAAQAQPVNGGHQDATMSFVAQAAQSDEFERQEGRLAAQRGHTMRIRHFGSEMALAHTMTTKGLKKAIHDAHMPPPPPAMLSGEQKRMVDDLQNARGPAFDKLYIDQQVQAHEQALQLMQGYAQTGAPGPIRDAAAKTTPMVQHHLEMARALKSHMG